MADKICFLLAWIVILCFSQVRAMGALSPLDPSSYSRPEKAVIKHISLALNVDFAKQVLSGQATLEFDVLDDINDVILDVSNLKIESIETEDGAQLQYKLSDHVPNFGSKLTVLIPKQQSSGDKKDETTSMKVENSNSDVVCECNIADSCVSSSDAIALQYTGFMYHALVDTVDSEYGSLDKASMGEGSSSEGSSSEASPEASSAEDSPAENSIKEVSTEVARTGVPLTAEALKGVAPADESLKAEDLKGVARSVETSTSEDLKVVASSDKVSTGEALKAVTSTDEVPTGEVQTGEVLAGELPTGKVPTGEVPTGEVLMGEVPMGKVPTGEVPTGEVPTDEVPMGEVPTVEVPKGDVPTGEVPTGKVLKVLSSTDISLTDEASEAVTPEGKALNDVALPNQVSTGEDFKGKALKDEVPKSKAKGNASTDKAAKDKGSLGGATIVNVMKHSHRSFGSIGSPSGIKCCDSILPILDVDGNRLKIRIKYSTDPTASALQWLDPEQTSGKKHPYLFSQCQPIHARSILPCQDTPAVKFTYDAEVTAPEEFTVLMSALRGVVKSNKTTFRQPMPLPSYLVALAVGVLESRDLGPRSKVWSEKEEIERSAWEFAETEKYLQAAEKLCGPYEWTAYDLLVLPPSFPYGGMENPCLTFVTPTLLAGDRSQADVIVHEIMHSWTGNLVTNRNFEHFWLNEGFTVFLERKVGASLINDSAEAKKSRDFHSLLGLQELSEAIQVFGASNSLTNLVVDLNGIHPDDAFSRVPYEKGSLFLRYLEDLVGGPEVFDDFLRSYLTRFSRKSLDTDQFKAYLLDYFKDNDKLGTVDWDSWLYKSGMPPIIPDYDTTMTKAISTLILKIDDANETISPADVTAFTPHQMIHLLQQLIDGEPLPLDRLRALGDQYKVSTSKNTEIQYRWLRLCVRSRDQSKLGEVFNFVNSQGRMKYVRPVYRDLYAWRDVRDQAIDNFLKNEKYMMHVSAYTLRKDLHLTEKTSKSTE